MSDYLFIIQIIGGFYLLIKGADILVDNASALAIKLGISEFLVGILIVSVGTSLPELVVSVYASFTGENSELIFGNVMGSNLANVFLVLGIFTIIYPTKIEWKLIKRDWWINVGVLLILFFLLTTFNQSVTGLTLELWNGIILLVLFVFFSIYVIKKEPMLDIIEEDMAKNIDSSNDNDSDSHIEPLKKSSSLKIVLFIILSSVMVGAGGKFVVDGSLLLAKIFNVSDGLVGFTIVAIGTSLPELVTSLVAAKRNSEGIALGNILGSNIFNVLWILGVATVIRPIVIPTVMQIDLAICAFSLLLLFVLVKVKSPNFNYIKSIPMLVCYMGYLMYLIERG